MKTRKIFTSIMIFAIFGSTLIAIKLVKKFETADEMPLYELHERPGDPRVNIAVIGGSYAGHKRLDIPLAKALQQKGVMSRIASSSDPGATTRRIYKNMFLDEELESSSKGIIKDNPDYVVTLGGCNDSAGQLGAKFYSEHQILTIKMLLKNGITPIVMLIPDFDIEGIMQDRDYKRWFVYSTYAWFNNRGDTDNRIDYIDRFLIDLSEEGLTNDVILIRPNTTRDMYKDRVHLNKIGYEHLAEKIANQIVKHEIKKTTLW